MKKLLSSRVIRWKHSKLLRQNLNFRFVNEMKIFIHSSRFWSYFARYVIKWIWSQQRQMREMFDIKDKESDLTSIQIRLMNDQRSKSNKYSNDYLDTFK